MEACKKALGTHVEVIEDTPGDSSWVKGMHLKLKVFQQAIEQDKPYFLFLEDDCVFTNKEDVVTQINEIINLCPDFDFLYGGFNPTLVPSEDLRTPVFKTQNHILDTQCVFMRRDSMVPLLNYLKPMVKETHPWHGRAMDNYVTYYIKYRNVKRYVCFPMIAIQDGTTPSTYPTVGPKMYYYGPDNNGYYHYPTDVRKFNN